MVPVRLLVFVLAGLAVTCRAGADWPEFRGPQGDGTAATSELPTSWSEVDNVKWRVPVPGLGWSSPTVVNGRVYVTTAVEIPPTDGAGELRSLRALCFSAADGTLIWDKELFQQAGKVEMHSKNSHASPTPLVAGGRVYVHFGPHGTACVSAENGALQWTTQELKYGPRHGTGGSPALAGDLLIICCDGHDERFVVGLDQATGGIRWKTPRDATPVKGFSFCTPLVITVAGKQQAVCPGSDAVFAYDPATGHEIWRVKYPDGYSVVPRPVFAYGLVVVCSGYDKSRLLVIDPNGTGDLTETHVKWSTDKGVPHNPSVVVVGDELYFVSDRGIATCADLATGAVHWTERVGGNFSASLLAVGDRIYFQDEAGQATIVRAAKTFEKIGEATFAPGERTFASYAVSDGALFIRSEKSLYRVQNGAKLADN